MERTRPHWSPRTKIVVSLLLLGAGLFLLYRFSVVLQPLVLAIVLAYVLSPPVAILHRRLKLNRTLAIFVVYLFALVLLALIPVILVPPLASQFNALNVDVQRIIVQAEALLGSKVIIAGQTIDLEAAFQQATGSLQTMIEPVLTQTFDVILEVISSLVWVIFVVIVSFYLIKDSRSLSSWVESHVPPNYQEDFLRLRFEISQIWAAFFRGQLLLALVVSIIFTVVCFLLGMPFALALAVLAGLLEFLPSIGHGIWLFIAAVLALFAGSTWIPLPNWAFMLIVIGLHLFYQQFDLNYLIPRIIGRSVHLPPLVVILGIVSGAVLAGVLGILLAAPTIASARVLARYLYACLFDLDPFPASVAQPLPPPNARWWRKPPAEPIRDLPKSV